MKKGLIVGKFYPPHAGHHHLIRSGKEHCDELTVLVCDRPEHLIPGKLRAQWLRKEHPNVNIRVINDQLDDLDSNEWAKLALKEMNGSIDIVFTSESYGEPWSKAIGCDHKLIDIDRTTFPCSGTAVRNNPYEKWDYLSSSVKEYFAFRVCVIGAESTGKTTLSKALAKHYRTNWVPEYGRTYTEKIIKNIWNYTWSSADFTKIAKLQARQEDVKASQSNKLVIFDTDVFATSIWHKRYLRTRSPLVESMAAKRPPIGLYILTDPKTPFNQDGYRDGENIREWMHQEFVDALTYWGKNYIFVSGSPENRLEVAIRNINRQMRLNAGISGKDLTL
jgi:HTH-type transcriptional repressor of NAD biosynthesis genes